MNDELLQDLIEKSEMLSDVIQKTRSRSLIYAAGVFAGILDAAEGLRSPEALAEAYRLYQEEVLPALDIDMAMVELEQP